MAYGWALLGVAVLRRCLRDGDFKGAFEQQGLDEMCYAV